MEHVRKDAHDGQPSTTPSGAWQRLRAGNQRFVAGQAVHPRQDAGRLATLVAGQHPWAVILSCADSRVPPEIVFDQGLGDLSVVRTAGHAADGVVLGSIEFAVTGLAVPLVVVLGHAQCAAVAAALQARATSTTPDGHLREVVEQIRRSMMLAGLRGLHPGRQDDTDWLVDEHVRHTCALLQERSRVLAEAMRAGRTALIAARYDLTDGVVRTLTWAGDPAGSGPEQPRSPDTSPSLRTAAPPLPSGRPSRSRRP